MLIIPEDFGGHPAKGPLSLWSMTELQTLEGLDDAHRGAGFSCQLGNAERGLATGVLSNLSSVSLFLHREVATATASSRRGLSSYLPRPSSRDVSLYGSSTTSVRLQKMARAIFSQVTVLAAFSGGSVSTASNQQTPSGWGSKVWSAADISLRSSSHFSPSFSSGTVSFRSLLDLWESRNLARGALRNYTGDIEFGQFFISPAASAALSQGRSSLASRCTFSFWPSATSCSSCLPIGPFFPSLPRVARTLQAEETGWRTSQLDCPKVGGTRLAKETGWKPSHLICERVGRTRRQAEQPGSRFSHLHQVGEEFLNSRYCRRDVLVVQAGYAGVCRGHLRRDFCEGAHDHHGPRKHPWAPSRGEMAM